MEKELEKIQQEQDIDIRIQKKLAILNDLNLDNFSALWVDIAPSDWVKWMGLVAAIVSIITLLVVIFKP